MGTSVILFIILGAISGLSYGDGVLPDRLIAVAGETVMFTTTVMPQDPPFFIVSWGFNDVNGVHSDIITSATEDIIGPAYTNRITLFRSTGSLEIRNLTLSDTGDYNLFMLLDATQWRGNCRLVIHAPVSNVKVTASSTDLVEFSSSVRLSCSSSGSSISFLWLNGSSEVTASDRVQLTDGGANLTIISVTRYDQGPFRCRVFNPVSEGTSDPVNLSVNYGPENTQLTPSPLQEYYDEGSNIILTCSADTRPPALFKWFLNGELLDDTGPELRLMNIQMSQSGNYICEAFNSKTLKSQRSLPSAVTVLAPVSNVKVTASSTDLVEFSSSVRLSCSSSGSSISFLWLNISSEVTASDRVQLTDGGANLTIVNVTRYDQGPFKCRAFNPISNVLSDPLNLLIMFGPENINLTISPPQEYYNEGSNVNMTCSADCRPPASIQWFLNGELLDDTGPELRLMNIQMSQSGNYSCQAFNSKTLKSQRSPPSAVTVLAPVSNVKVTASSTNMVEFSSSVRLSCSSSGSSISFLWLNGSSEVTASDRVQLTDGGANLTIVNVTRYDKGPLKCHAFNNYSNGTSDPLNLLIMFGPENINLAISPSQEYYNEGSNVNMTCSADCRPPASIQWFLNGELLDDTGPELRLMNIQMSQSGNYSCQAFNNRTMRNQTSLPSLLSVLKSQSSTVVITANTTDLVEFSSSVRLSCSSTGSSMSFLWLNGSSEVTASDRVQLTDGSANLTIISVTRYDQGPFRCHAFNNFTNGTSDPVRLYISYGPNKVGLAMYPFQEHFAEGSNISLFCSADSRPPALFKWFLNGELLEDTGPVLRLRNIQVNQSGNYSCGAFNNNTMRNQTSEPVAITVQTPVSNVVVTVSSTDMVEFNSSVRLSCSSSGSSISFLWLNISSEVTASDRVLLTDGGANLTIVKVNRYDHGPFSCKVSNGATTAISQPVNLFIQYGPDSTTIKGPESVRVGDFAMLYCTTTSVPSPTFTWLYNGKPTNVHEAVYMIPSIRVFDSGTFSCTAVNAVTGLSQTVSHELYVVDSSDSCDCSTAAGRAVIITVGCFLLIAAVCGITVYVNMRRHGYNKNYPACRKEKLSVKDKNVDTFRLSEPTQNGMSSFEA